MENDIPMITLKEMHEGFLILKKKTKVLEIAKKYLDKTELMTIKNYFSQLLFDRKKNVKLKDYKHYFGNSHDYKTNIDNLSYKFEEQQLNDYLGELIDLYYLIIQDEFLLVLDNFDVLCLKDRKITLYKKG